MRWVVAIGGVLAALVVVGVLLTPAIATWYANRVLRGVEGYDAAVAEAWVDWSRADLRLSGVVFERPGIAQPFITVDEVRVDPHLRSWLRGNRTVDVAVNGMSIAYVVGPDAARSQTALDLGWMRRRLQRFPVAVDDVVVRDGMFHFRDDPAEVSVEMSWQLDADNLANRARVDERLFGELVFQGTVEGHAPVLAHAQLDPFAPRFSADVQLDGLRLVSVNDALRSYLRVDAEAGTFSVRSSIDGTEEGFEGRAHPEVEGLELLRNEGRDQEPPLRAIWEGVVGVVGKIGEVVTPGRDEIDVSLPISGEFGETPALVAVAEALPRAWFGAFARVASVGTRSAEQTAEQAEEVGKATKRARKRNRE